MTVYNTFTIKEEAGITTNNYPVQIGRPFVLGEISNYPQVVLSGTPLITQADVKTRWSDGSVKHSILSFYVPTLSANSNIILTFQNQTSGNNSGYETKTAMLSASYDFDAGMILTSGSSISASARTMLNNDDYKYWTSGSISTTIILSNHSSSRTYDIGFDSSRSFRPIFHATFWPLINKVKIRYIGEGSNTQYLQDQFYSLSLTKGNASPATFYTKNSINHWLASRWTKETWIGTSATPISINHNVGYLASTNQIFNYDPTKTISESTISADYSSWLSSNRDLYGNSLLTKYMPTTGGRGDIGPYPVWTTKWLYTGDYRHTQIALNLADLAGAWPFCYREGISGRSFISGVSAIGMPISVISRPTVAIYNWTIGDTLAADKLSAVGLNVNSDWIVDVAHHPDLYSPVYMLTGEYWYLEQLIMWACSMAAYDNPGYRGPSPSTGFAGLSDALQVRGEGWIFRTRCHAGILAPDGSPEKTYIERCIGDAITCWEAKLGISGTSYTGTALYNWTVSASPSNIHNGVHGIPPLGNFSEGFGANFVQAEYGIDVSSVSVASSMFEHHIMFLCLGRGKELGYATSALVDHISEFYNGMLNDSGSNPYILGNGRIPNVRLSDNTFYSTWSDWMTGYTSAWQVGNTSAFPLTDPEFGYDFLGLATVSYVVGSGSYESWDFVSTKILPSSQLNLNPKFAILSRGNLTSLFENVQSFKVHKVMRIYF